MAADCEVCNATMQRPEPPDEATDFCSNCAYEMLDCAADLAVAAFVNVEISFDGSCHVVIGEDIGPGIVDTRYGPWSLGEAYRRAKAYANSEDPAVLSPSNPEEK